MILDLKAALSADRAQWPFQRSEYLVFAETGPASLVGVAILFREDGRAIHAANAPVIAFPDTPYVREIVAILRKGKALETSPFKGDLLPAVWRECRCDSKGVFRLEGLQDLPYLVAVEFQWVANEISLSGTLISPVRLRPGLNNIVVTNRDPAS